MATVAILGAGTMGSGIAQVAAVRGWHVLLRDVDPAFVEKQIAGIRKQLDRLVERAKMTAGDRDATAARLTAASDPDVLHGADLIIEAIIENLDAKIAALAPLAERAKPDAIIASNTSSLSIGRLATGLELGSAALRQDGVRNPTSRIQNRVVGMHFFNPVPLMPLVEIISAPRTDPAVADRAAAIAASWGKTVVRAKDTPGFIVNRVARGYYLESLRMLGEGVAGVDEIDATLKRLGGFRMGPFELMDLIGIDVNYSVTVSVWEQMDRPARLTPHPIQKQLVDRGHLGRKTKQGVYSYQTEHPVPAVPVERRSFALPPTLQEAIRRFVDAAAKPVGAAQGTTPAAPATAAPADTLAGSLTEQYIFARVLAAIINEAALALDEGVATQADIDTAMKLGTNYPSGPLAWADTIGRHTCASLLRRLNEAVSDDRFAPAAALA